jgi:hypothetical protein
VVYLGRYVGRYLGRCAYMPASQHASKLTSKQVYSFQGFLRAVVLGANFLHPPAQASNPTAGPIGLKL